MGLNKNGLTIKQQKFCDAYIETGNGSEAARQAYDIGGKGGPLVDSNKETSAGAISGENLKKPSIRGYLDSEVKAAKLRIVELSKTAMMEPVRLAANKDICDRTEGKPIQGIDHTTGGKAFNIPQETKDKMDKRLKKIL